ncbi:MAG: hypothetical protein K0S08_384 [Gammaproteobacteria bacterium]|jgi:uncharacterized membrane protein YfcA|nr:hypothetical protein [Gammaproteobacteria bacterium]
MLLPLFFSLIFLFSFFAGIIGALTGLGGGLILIPFLVLFLHINIHYAMGAGLLAVMTTSSGAALSFLKQGYTNIRLGMFLEIAAAVGALLGAHIAVRLPGDIVQFLFGIIFFGLAILSWRRHEGHAWPTHQNATAKMLHLDGQCPDEQGVVRPYFVQRVWTGFSIMGVAGILSGLLGIGSGVVKVLAMDQAMALPYRVSTSTSNFILGITAAVGAGVFFQQGFIEPIVVLPVILGVFIGAFLGSKLMSHLPIKHLRRLFSLLVFLLALQMLLKALGVWHG